MKEFITKGLYLALDAIGYNSLTNAFHQIFLIKNKFLASSVFMVSIGGGLIIWIERWVYSPGATYVVFLALTIAESVFGTVKSTWYLHEKFDLTKSARIIPKIIAHSFALSSAWHMAQSDVLLGWMPSTIFIYFSTQNFLKTILHMIDMKWMDGNFANFIREKFVLNNVQDDKKD